MPSALERSGDLKEGVKMQRYVKKWSPTATLEQRFKGDIPCQTETNTCDHMG